MYIGDYRTDSSMTLYVILSLQIILIVGTWAALKRVFGLVSSLIYLGFILLALAINLCLGFRAGGAYATEGGWTAAALTPVLYWMNGCAIVVICFTLWFQALWIARHFRRRRSSDGEALKSHCDTIGQ